MASAALPDYFALYDLPETFLPDEVALRTAYYRLSREFHPDFHANRPLAEQHHALEMATLNTDAWRTLSDFDQRLAYLLRRHGLLADGQTPSLPPAFLAEVMDLNEELMELPLAGGAGAERVAATVEALSNELEASIQPTLLTYPALPETARIEARRQVLDYYLKRRYVARMREQLAKFVPPSAP